MSKINLKKIIFALFRFLFSFRGTIQSADFFLASLFFLEIGNIVYHTEYYFLKYITLLIIFYSSLALIKKRSYDLCQTGNLSVVLLTLCFAFMISTDFVSLKVYNIGVAIVMMVLMGIIIYYSLKPQCSKKDLTQGWYLLKHPNIYFVVCVLISALGFGILKNL